MYPAMVYCNQGLEASVQNKNKAPFHFTEKASKIILWCYNRVTLRNIIY